MTIPEVTVDELAEAIAGGAVVIDVREVEEYTEAHVPGALLFPLSGLADAVDSVPVASPLYVICRSGARSMRACQFLAGTNRSAVNVAGGTLAWLGSGRPVATGIDPA